MAAEDYIDFAHLHSDDIGFVSGDEHGNTPYIGQYKPHVNPDMKKVKKVKKLKSGKNKDVEWVTGQGEIIRVADMEDSHLCNTIRYITKRMGEHDNAAKFMAARGFPIPPYVIGKRSGDEWLSILGKEALRRQNKAIEQGKLVLNSNNI